MSDDETKSGTVDESADDAGTAADADADANDDGAGSEALVPGTQLVLRSAGVRDIDAIQSLHTQLAATEDNPFTRFVDNAAQVAWELKRARKQLMASERYLCTVAELGDELVGYCAATIETSPSIFALRRYATISEVYVVESQRRRAVATALLEHLSEGLRARGIEWIEIGVTRGQESGRAMLDRLGFEEVSRTYGRRLRDDES